jgi:hypothetical protein
MDRSVGTANAAMFVTVVVQSRRNVCQWASIDRYSAAAVFLLTWLRVFTLCRTFVPIPLCETAAAFPLEPTPRQLRADSAGQGR